MIKKWYFNFRIYIITSGYFGLRWLDDKLINWKAETPADLKELWAERHRYMLESEKLGSFNKLDEEKCQRWMMINKESDIRYPVRYMDIRKVFRFLYHKDPRWKMTREERITFDNKCLVEVRKIMKKA